MNLLTESDCLKWLGDFEEKTNTEWKVDKDATRISQSNKVTIRVLQITNYYIETQYLKKAPICSLRAAFSNNNILRNSIL